MLKEYARHKTLVGKGFISTQNKREKLYTKGGVIYIKCENNSVEMIPGKTKRIRVN